MSQTYHARSRPDYDSTPSVMNTLDTARPVTSQTMTLLH
jgi:hypothetical protein